VVKDDHLRQFEDALEREFAALPALEDVAPARETVVRVQAAVRAAAQPAEGGYRRMGWRGGLGLAAAVLLSVVLWPPGPVAQDDPLGPLVTDEAVELDEWAAAWDETSTAVGDLIEVGLDAEAGDPDVNEWFESLDQTFQRFEEL
jgi:hypothetical protein